MTTVAEARLTLMVVAGLFVVGGWWLGGVLLAFAVLVGAVAWWHGYVTGYHEGESAEVLRRTKEDLRKAREGGDQ